MSCTIGTLSKEQPLLYEYVTCGGIWAMEATPDDSVTS